MWTSVRCQWRYSPSRCSRQANGRGLRCGRIFYILPLGNPVILPEEVNMLEVFFDITDGQIRSFIYCHTRSIPFPPSLPPSLLPSFRSSNHSLYYLSYISIPRKCGGANFFPVAACSLDTVNTQQSL